MRNDVRVRRDWIDVRHEYLQSDGRWLAGACGKPGFCRECNRDGERNPMPFISKAWEPGVPIEKAARIVIAAHLFFPTKLADDDATIDATPFTRFRIAHHLEILRGGPIADADILAAKTVGEMIVWTLQPLEVAR